MLRAGLWVRKNTGIISLIVSGFTTALTIGTVVLVFWYARETYKLRVNGERTLYLLRQEYDVLLSQYRLTTEPRLVIPPITEEDQMKIVLESPGPAKPRSLKYSMMEISIKEFPVGDLPFIYALENPSSKKAYNVLFASYNPKRKVYMQSYLSFNDFAPGRRDTIFLLPKEYSPSQLIFGLPHRYDKSALLKLAAKVTPRESETGHHCFVIYTDSYNRLYGNIRYFDFKNGFVEYISGEEIKAF